MHYHFGYPFNPDGIPNPVTPLDLILTVGQSDVNNFGYLSNPIQGNLSTRYFMGKQIKYLGSFGENWMRVEMEQIDVLTTIYITMNDIQIALTWHIDGYYHGSSGAMGSLWTYLGTTIGIGNKTPIILSTTPAILVNGYFSDGATGWTGLIVTNGVASTDGGALGSQIFDTEIGVDYIYQLDVDRAGVTPDISIRENDEFGTQLDFQNFSGTGMRSYSFSFTATTLKSCFAFSNGSNTALIDNCIVRKAL